MAKEFTLDLGPLEDLIRKTPEAVARGAKLALDEIKDDWVEQARNIAPLNTTNLRREIDGEVTGSGFDAKVIVAANATGNYGGKDFNYAYYIHEGHMAEDGKSLRTAGTVEKFLEESQDEAKWQRWLEENIKSELNGEGW
ncbi:MULTISPECIES: hypothetical protein [Peribacillus]|uniref:hypothetical protein n=1 Tax=Peribacillus TaxID=2675229 RepID=UPI001F4DE4CD|nr:MULTISPECIES: hypothetical protein [unclassified Peribacillus]MCK1985170.1 hypothetical protein [Peribacillus sp. Aquil_B1]MCK2007180.1 hypothetical protein [Peribacillus sp. Aquil_B8]